MAEITSIDELEAWLKGQDRRVSEALAARSALRAMPAPMAVADQKRETFDGAALFLACIRGSVVSAAAAVCPAADTITRGALTNAATLSAAHSATLSASAFPAAAAARSATLSTYATHSAAAFSATHSVRSTYATHSATLYAAFEDALLSADQMLASPLWPDPGPAADLLADWDAFKTSAAPEWAWWVRWYAGLLDGALPPWEILRDVALIEADVWDAGPEAVAKEVRRLQRLYVTSVSPTLVMGEDGRLDVETDVDVAAEPLDFAIDQVRIELAAVLTSGRGNGLSDTSYETQLIERGIAARANPSVVATRFWNACMALSKRMEDGDYPDDPPHLALKATLYTSVEELCLQDDLIRARIARLAALEPRRDPSPDERAEIARVPDEVEEVLTERAQTELKEVVDVVVATDKPPRWDRARLINWLTRIGKGIETAQKGEKKATWVLQLASRIAGWFRSPDDGSDDLDMGNDW